MPMLLLDGRGTTPVSVKLQKHLGLRRLLSRWEGDLLIRGRGLALVAFPACGVEMSLFTAIGDQFYFASEGWNRKSLH